MSWRLLVKHRDSVLVESIPRWGRPVPARSLTCDLQAHVQQFCWMQQIILIQCLGIAWCLVIVYTFWTQESPSLTCPLSEGRYLWLFSRLPKLTGILYSLFWVILRRLNFVSTLRNRLCLETSAHKIQTPGNHPKERIHVTYEDGRQCS